MLIVAREIPSPQLLVTALNVIYLIHEEESTKTHVIHVSFPGLFSSLVMLLDVTKYIPPVLILVMISIIIKTII